MIHFYENKLPDPNNELVIVRITYVDKQSLVIRCILLEYSDDSYKPLDGMICHTNLTRKTIKRYKRIEVGDIIPVLCSAVHLQKDGSYCIDLNYTTLDKKICDHHIEMYRNVVKIIDTFIMISAENLCKFQDNIIMAIYLDDIEIRNMVEYIVKNTIHTLSKDEIYEIFNVSIYKLHKEYLTEWCDKLVDIPNFRKHIEHRYPLPIQQMEFDITYTSFASNGVSCIQHFCNDIVLFIKSNTNYTDVSITNITSPLFRIIIKAIDINQTDLDNVQYIIKEHINTTYSDNTRHNVILKSYKLSN
jgi:translation initiation factor 2 alpha subunit (eIF-2alpha)